MTGAPLPDLPVPGGRHDDLADALDAVRALVDAPPDRRTRAALPDPPPGSTLARLAGAFGLDAFALAVVQLTVLLELHPGIDARFAALNGSDQRPWPTFGLALAL